ncbi:MAG: glycosyltransferase [Granulosicoccus sp.]|nr:glycosyltransferase [Granulosicoccus sp.]
MPQDKALSVLFTTYNSPLWLQKVLWSLLEQTYRHFEIIIADDGSCSETRHMIDGMVAEFETSKLSLSHVWQSDQGFRKCRILNKSLMHAAYDYIVFTDGDCVLRNDFLETHAKRRKTGCYLSGTYFKLPMQTSEAISRDDIVSQRCFDRRWLVANGLSGNRGRLKLARNARLTHWLNRLTPTACNLKGSNASAWKSDLLAVGGLDERLHSGGQDRELGVRLQNHGIHARHVRYDAICLHLDHARGYRDVAKVKDIREHRLNVQKRGIAHTEYGTDRLTAEGYGTLHLER